jgi:hypothetical protein
MRIAKLLTAMTLDSNSFWPIDLGLLALKSVILQCRTAKDVYLANDPLGINYFTLKSGSNLVVDLDGGVLDVTNGPELLSYGDLGMVKSASATLTCTQINRRITRGGTGSFITEGFKPGMIITTDISGNLGPFTVLGVSESYINVTSGLTNSGPDAAKTVTQDITANWSFDADDWTYQIISGDIDKDQNGVTALSQNFVTIPGGHYRIGYTVSDQSVAGFTVKLGETTGLSRTISGTYVDYLLVTGSTGGLVFTPADTSRFTLDAISVKRVTFPANSSPIYVKGSDTGLYLEIIALQ